MINGGEVFDVIALGGRTLTRDGMINKDLPFLLD
jgi:hypothetical protein